MKKEFKTKPDFCQDCGLIFGVNCPEEYPFEKDLEGKYLIDKRKCSYKKEFIKESY